MFRQNGNEKKITLYRVKLEKLFYKFLSNKVTLSLDLEIKYRSVQNNRFSFARYLVSSSALHFNQITGYRHKTVINYGNNYERLTGQFD